LEKKIDALSSQLATRSVAGDAGNPKGIAPADAGDPKRTASADERGGPGNQNQKALGDAQAQAATAAAAGGQQVATAAPGGQPGDARTGPPPALASTEDADALRELQVVRDQAVTTKKGGVDVSLNARYVRNTTPLQFSRAVIGT